MIKTLSGLTKHYHEASKGVQEYFVHLPKLLAAFPLEVSLSYVFSQVELAHNTALYCAAVKLHRADAAMAKQAIDAHHMTRGGFQEKFEVVFGKAIPKSTAARLKAAESTRDKVMHGKAASDAEKRNAIAAVLTYAGELNDFVYSVAAFRPFGRLRGFKGRTKSLDSKTTRWILKGMGFPVG